MALEILTDRQRLFVEEYLMDLNATRAAIRAGYSPDTARQMGAENLSKPVIQQFLQSSFAERNRRNNIAADDILQRLEEECAADIVDLFSGNYRLRPPHEWPLVWRRGLVEHLSVSEVRDLQGESRLYRARIRFAPRIRYLELLGRHAGAFLCRERSP